MRNEKKEKRFQYSKILPIVTGIIFILCLYKVFSVDMTNYVDLTIYATALTVTGASFSTTIVWYMKKAQSENSVKLKMELYKVASKSKLEYNEKMMKLKNKYEMNDNEIYEIENGSIMDTFEDSALLDVTNSIDNAQSEADASIELQSY